MKPNPCHFSLPALNLAAATLLVSAAALRSATFQPEEATNRPLRNRQAPVLTVGRNEGDSRPLDVGCSMLDVGCFPFLLSAFPISAFRPAPSRSPDFRLPILRSSAAEGGWTLDSRLLRVPRTTRNGVSHAIRVAGRSRLPTTRTVPVPASGLTLSMPKTSNVAKGTECISFSMFSVFSGLCSRFEVQGSGFSIGCWMLDVGC